MLWGGGGSSEHDKMEVDEVHSASDPGPGCSESAV